MYKLITLSIFLRSECFAVRDDFRLSTVKYQMFRSKALDIIIEGGSAWGLSFSDSWGLSFSDSWGLSFSDSWGLSFSIKNTLKIPKV